MLLVPTDVDGDRPTKVARVLPQLLRAMSKAGAAEGSEPEPELHRTDDHMSAVQDRQSQRLYYQQSLSDRAAAVAAGRRDL